MTDGSDEAPEPQPGDRIADRYVLVRRLGGGGMGQVFEATDERLPRKVAIKFLRSDRSSPQAMRRIEQEARAAASIQHPNVVAVHDLGWHDGQPFIVSELLAGRTLRDRLAEGRLPLAEALHCAAQLASGLESAHASGVVHRDLKPENLILCGSDTLKIVDFGIARVVPADNGGTPSEAGPRTATGEVLGTSGYMSPEQVRSEPAGPASDIFSAGAVLYEMLTARPAFPGGTMVERSYAILRGTPLPLPPELPAAVRDTVERCLRKRPADRFHSAADLAFALRNLAGLRAPRPLGAGGVLARRIALVAAAGAVLALLIKLSGRAASPARLPAGTEQMLSLASAQSRVAGAIDAFREGELAFRRGLRAEATTAYRRAVALDDNLVVAHYRIAVAASVTEPGLAEDSVRRAIARAGTDAQMKRLAEGLLALIEGRSEEAVSLYRAQVAEEPDSVEGWAELGDALFHSAPFRGEPAEVAADSFARALAIDPGEPAALEHFIDLSELRRHAPSTRRLATNALDLLDERSSLSLSLRWTLAWSSGQVQQRRALSRELASATAQEIRSAFVRATWEEENLSGAQELAQSLIGRSTPFEQAQGLEMAALVSWARGQPRRAFAVLDDSDRRASLATNHFLRAWLLAELPGSERDAAQVERALQALRAVAPSSGALLQALSLQMQGRLVLELGKADQAEAIARELEQRQIFERSSLTTDLALALRARMAAAAGKDAQALELLERMKFVYPYRYATLLSRQPDALLRSEILERRGDLRRALGWVESHAFHGPYEMLFLGRSLLRRARLEEKLGDRRNALAHYRWLAALWADSEPSVRPDLEAAVSGLSRNSPQ